MSGSIKMVKGQSFPIEVRFETYHNKAFLQVAWEWTGQPRSLVPADALSFSLAELPPDIRFEFDYVGMDNIQNWVHFEPDLPAQLRKDGPRTEV